MSERRETLCQAGKRSRDRLQLPQNLSAVWVLLQVDGVPLKNSQVVEFGERLDLARFMAANALDGGSAVYHLYGIIVHEGMHNSPHFGHYVAYVRGADGRWWECNDAQVGGVEVYLYTLQQP